MTMKLNQILRLGSSLALITTTTLQAQEIESVEMNGENVRVRVKTPPIEIERINSDGSTTTEVVADEEQRTIDLDVPIDDPTKLFRAKVQIGENEFGSPPQPLVEAGSIPNPDEVRPSSISLNNNILTMQFPPTHSQVENGGFYENGFPLVLEDSTIQLQPTGTAGIFAGELPAETADQLIINLSLGLDRLRNLGNGTVPVYMGRQLTGHLAVPDPAALGTSFDLFPFVNGGTIQPVVTAGTPVLGSAAAVDPAKSLIITDLSVVEDPDRTWDPFAGGAISYIDPSTLRPRKWTFGYLMEEMCNSASTGLDPRFFTRRWIQHFETPQMINFDPVPDRGGVVQTEIIDKWRARNAAEFGVDGSGAPLDPWNLKNCPFRLTAIVNRVDLRSGSAYATGDAGECRFVFCAYDLDTGLHLPFTVIFEYAVPLSTCLDIKNWASDWQALTSDSFGSGTFNPALEALTDVVTLANAAPTKPNGSALHQLRTNNFLGGRWTLREFQITGSGTAPNDLTEVTVKQTPADSKQGTADLTAYINGFEPDILAGSHTVPLSFPGATPFLGGKSEVTGPTFFWDSPGISNNDARHCFSLNTCNGCHGGEAGAFLAPSTPASGSIGFVHIGERDPGVESHLSRFLTGTSGAFTDPVSGVVRDFDDLTRRAADLDFVANMPCFIVSITPGVATLSH